MPGYVMHLVEAKEIIETLQDKMQISPEWEQRFLTGALLPDTRLKGEKRYSHFWNPAHLDQLALAPDLALFMAKYQAALQDPVVLGYLAHLHLDACYVRDIWPASFTFYDDAGQPQIVREKIKTVSISRLHREVPLCSFFSKDYYYGEYTKMNGYFIEKYKLTPPDWRLSDEHLPITEVHLQDMQLICDELNYLLAHCRTGDETQIKIFTLTQLETFMRASAAEFMTLYSGYVG